MLELQMHEAHLLRRQKMTVSQIADELGCSERTVYYYLSQPPRPRKRRIYTSKLDDFKPYIDSVIENEPDYNREVLLKELMKRGYQGSITILRDYAAGIAERVSRQAVIRFETVPGHQAQVDWKELGRRTVSGERRKVYAFTMVLGYSRTPFVLHTLSMDQATLLACHELAFRHFGGVPAEVLYDNMKTAFYRDGEGRWKANRHLLRLANHYGFIPKRCRVRRPQTKGKVERFIRTYDEGFLRYLEDGLCLDMMNARVGSWVEELMDKKLRNFDATRRERLIADQKAMVPLPEKDFGARRIQLLRVSRESLVTYKTNRYSVPPRYIGMDLTLKLHPLDGDGSIFCGDTLVRDVPRIEGRRDTFWRDEDRQAVQELWKRQSGPRPNRERFSARPAPSVDTRTPSVYDRLIPAGVSA